MYIYIHIYFYTVVPLTAFHCKYVHSHLAMFVAVFILQMHNSNMHLFLHTIQICICFYNGSILQSKGWQRRRGCLKVQVIFRKRATNWRALFRKMTYGDKASYGSSPPCMWCVLPRPNVYMCLHIYICLLPYSVV